MVGELETLQDLLGHLRVQIADMQTGARVSALVPDPDVVVVADPVPLMPARELVARTREIFDPRVEVPLIVLTTTAADRRASLLDAGADDCLSVPFAAAELQARVARLVQRRRQTHDSLPLNRRAGFGQSPQSANDAPRMFRREGDYWTIGYLGVTLRLRDCKGLRHLARLLEHPHNEVHALTLTAPPSEGHGQVAAAIAVGGTDGWRSGLGDAGVILDARAKDAYRRRLEQLKDMRDEACRFGDRARIGQIEAEMHALAHELATAMGFGGRDRRAAASAERARINVTRTIKAAIDAIAEHHRPLAQHLRTAVRTGIFSCYAPMPGAGDSWFVVG